jgi:dTDP-4-amino-4,6-dideoxygalactose transaminase
MNRRIPPIYTPIPPLSVFLREPRSVGYLLRVALDALASRYPAHEISLVDSGTSALRIALHLALSASPKSDRPTIALPAWSCPDIATAALALGAQLRLYDLSPERLEPDLNSVEAALIAGARVLVVPHFFGRIIDITSIMVIARSYGAVVVEDAAQHAGGSYNGIRGGGLADLAILSFGRGKGLNAGGGGALLRRRGAPLPPLPRPISPRTLNRYRDIATIWTTDWLSHPALFRIPSALPWLRLGETLYRAPRPVEGIGLTSLHLLPWTLSHEPEQMAIRRANETWYASAFNSWSDVSTLAIPPTVASGALRFPIILRQRLVRDDLPGSLRELGIVRSYPRTLLGFPEILAACLNPNDSFPGADRLAASLITLPTHQFVTSRDRERIVRELRRHILLAENGEPPPLRSA